ncbi:MAG: hypothetical protein ABIH42_10985 [Planctomycetota bacterium]
MSVLAKVFVIINLVFSIAFLTVSGAMYHHKMNWREEFTKLGEEYKKLKERDAGVMERLNSKIKEYKDYIEDRENKIVDLANRIEDIGQQYRDAKTDLALETQEMTLLLTDHSRVVMVLKGMDEKIRALTNEKDFFHKKFNEAMAQKNTAENQVTRLINIKLDLEKDKSDLLKAYTQVRKELNDKKLVLQRLRDFGIPVEKIVLMHPPKPIDAEVVAYDDPTRLVILSVGRKHGVEEGYEFTIYRGARFIARVKVERVLPDMCGCRVIFEVSKIERGDLAATRLH